MLIWQRNIARPDSQLIHSVLQLLDTITVDTMIVFKICSLRHFASVIILSLRN